MRIVPCSAALLIAAQSLLASCGDPKGVALDAVVADAKLFDDAPIDAADPNNPATLFDTGLCVDRACTAVNADIHEYTPQFALWADTATKKRWYWVPPGTQIDTTDMDHWDFPVGAKFWKEFSRDGVRVETRLEMRIGAGTTVQSWLYTTYAWNDTQTDTTKAPTAGVQNANGTQHDIPSQFACRGCHENFAPTRVLGFGAIELDHPAGMPGNADDTTLASLVAAGTLTANPAAPASVGAPSYPIQGTEVQKAGLGYVFANCSHCHNPASSVYFNVPMALRMTVATVGNKATSLPYLTAVDHYAHQPTGLVAPNCTTPNNMPAECIIDSGDPMNSDLIKHFIADPASNLHMPQLGSEMMDPDGLAILNAWISNP
ncbi:hypothetical protein BH11MYX1_BH11MYX1_26530 [soil metagenome]